MLEKRKKAGHYIPKEGTPLSSSQESLLAKYITLLVNKHLAVPYLCRTLGWMLGTWKQIKKSTLYSKGPQSL